MVLKVGPEVLVWGPRNLQRGRGVMVVVVVAPVDTMKQGGRGWVGRGESVFRVYVWGLY